MLALPSNMHYHTGSMATTLAPAEAGPVLFETAPERYRHWRLSVEGRVATLTLDIDEDAGIRPGYKLKLNSYDLGVDIELHDALQRIRFEHPAVASVVITSAKERTFCAGANIYMLGTSSHAWKVNFCKFTNETRNGMEDSSRHDGLRFVAAVNGSCAGGGYEVALACDEILMIDDRSTTVSLPEVPLLGVLPGTGGLTRLVDKRGVRRDLADVFCTNADGVRAERAKQWKLIDGYASPSEFAALVARRAAALAAESPRDASAQGIALRPLERTIDERGYHYRNVEVAFDRAARNATLTVRAPQGAQPEDADDVVALGDAWWPLATARELDDALLMLRTNELELGLLVLRTEGDPEMVLAADRLMLELREHWLVRETLGLLRRTFARLDVSARSLYAVADQGSCFAGLLAELALAADRTYMLALPDDEPAAPQMVLDELNDGLLPMVNGHSRLETRFAGDAETLARLRDELGRRYTASDALDAGLVTAAPDDLDWEDEIRLAFEERAALSPDALTAMEANLRFPGTETLETKIFGRLSAWQNWVFYRPNSTGERGALKLFGTGSKPHFDRERV
jgi:benzoyl-CoA-dihydrodiol lyase